MLKSAVFPDILRNLTLMCLGKTNAGAPRHPLYLPKTARLELWRML